MIAAAAAAFRHLFQLLGVAAAEHDILGLKRGLQCDVAASATRFRQRSTPIASSATSIDTFLDRLVAAKQNMPEREWDDRAIDR